MSAHFEFEYLWGLGLALLLAVAGIAQQWRRYRSGPAMAYARVDLLSSLPTTPLTLLSRLSGVLRLVGLVALALACARPQLEEFERRDVEGIDIFLVVDMSGSMAAVDMHPDAIRRHQVSAGAEPPNRFGNAITTLRGFVRGRSRDRIGMVVFAREAYLQFPLTLDYSTIQTLLSRLELEAIDSSSTAIGNALGLGVRGLLNSQARSRAIILITDGKQQGGNISPAQAAETAAGEGMLLYTILVGAEGPTMAPSNLYNRDGTRRYVQQDYPVDAALLSEIAEATGGHFYRAAEPEELEVGLNAILDDLETTAMDDVASVSEVELYYWFALVALLALLFEGVLAWAVARRFP